MVMEGGDQGVVLGVLVGGLGGYKGEIWGIGYRPQAHQATQAYLGPAWAPQKTPARALHPSAINASQTLPRPWPGILPQYCAPPPDPPVPQPESPHPTQGP